MNQLLDAPGIVAEYIPLPDAAPEEPARPPQPPETKPLADLKRREANDPTELLRTGYLCRGAGLLLCGPTGIGIMPGTGLCRAV